MRRLFGGKNAADDVSGSKPIKANMGKKLDMYYNSELGRWVSPGDEERLRSDMNEKRAPPPAFNRGGPPSPLPSNAKQGVPPWMKPSADHRRIQSFHQPLAPAQADDPPEEVVQATSRGDAPHPFPSPPPNEQPPPARGRLGPSPPMGPRGSVSGVSVPPPRRSSIETLPPRPELSSLGMQPHSGSTISDSISRQDRTEPLPMRQDRFRPQLIADGPMMLEMPAQSLGDSSYQGDIQISRRDFVTQSRGDPVLLPKAMPLPRGTMPLLRGDMPLRGDMLPPRGDMPVPRGEMPPPRGDLPPSRGDMPPLRGDMPLPRGDVPPPRGSMPPPRGDVPPPRGDMPPPRGDMPPPRGDMPPSRGDVPPPRGDMPPSTGNMPPPRGDMPPPRGDVPPPRGDMPPPTTQRMSLPKGDIMPPPRGDFLPFQHDMAPARGDVMASLEDQPVSHGGVGLWQQDVQLRSGDVSPFRGELLAPHEKLPPCAEISMSRGALPPSHGHIAASRGEMLVSHGEQSTIHGDLPTSYGETQQPLQPDSQPSTAPPPWNIPIAFNEPPLSWTAPPVRETGDNWQPPQSETQFATQDTPQQDEEPSTTKSGLRESGVREVSNQRTLSAQRATGDLPRKHSCLDSRRRMAGSPRGLPYDHNDSGAPLLVVRRASRTRMQNRSPPISRRGTLRSEAGDVESPGRTQPVVTFDRVAFRSKYSNTIQTLDEVFSSILEIYSAESRKIGKAAGFKLNEHLDRIVSLVPGTKTASQVIKFKQLLGSVDTDSETKSSDRVGSENLVAKHLELMMKEFEDALKRQKVSLEELQEIQERVIEEVRDNSYEMEEDEKRMMLDRTRTSFDDVLNIMTDIRNEVEEITCLSDSLLGQRRVAEESFQLSLLQIGREIENHFVSHIKPRLQETIHAKITAIKAEYSSKREELKSEMQATAARSKHELEQAKYQLELEKVELLNDLDHKKEDFQQLTELKEALSKEKMAFEAYKLREEDQIQLEKQEVANLKSYLEEQQVNLNTQQVQLNEKLESLRVLQETLTTQQEQISKDKIALDAEKEYLEHEKKRIIIVSKGLDARRMKLAQKDRQKNKKLPTEMTVDSITETC